VNLIQISPPGPLSPLKKTQSFPHCCKPNRGETRAHLRSAYVGLQEFRPENPISCLHGGSLSELDVKFRKLDSPIQQSSGDFSLFSTRFNAVQCSGLMHEMRCLVNRKGDIWSGDSSILGSTTIEVGIVHWCTTKLRKCFTWYYRCEARFGSSHFTTNQKVTNILRLRKV
jgi:hypothetical protein